jgi:DNA-binding beta-propeller fold protein YncE
MKQPEEVYMKFRSLMTAICVLATAQIVSAAPFAYIANTGNTPRTVSVIDTADNSLKTPLDLRDVNGAGTLPDPNPYAITVGASGQYVYVGVQDTNEVQVIDPFTTAAVKVVKNIGLQTDKPGGLAVNAAETRLYVAANNSNTLRIIDISGSGAVEVGRVTVSDSAQSVPEGVVLNSTGTKAYVANSADGQDSIAEITLDEANNTYTRTSIIPLPAGSKPYGLAINGTKLYFSSFNGNAGVVDTTTRAVTSLPTGLGNLSIAVNPANSKVYAPSNAQDKLYSFDGTATPVIDGGYPNGVIYPVPLLGNTSAAGPRGISLTPDGLKLFVAMNLDDTVKVYDTTNLATQLASISLPPGAKPNSFGNFIGPVWDKTIAASATSTCTITPSGSVPVNSYGWTFAISPGCDVVVNNVSKGAVSIWRFTNVTDNSNTIVANPVPGATYTVSGDWITSVNGFLEGYENGVKKGIDQLHKSAEYGSGTTVTLKAASGFRAINWTDDCSTTADGQECILPILSANKLFGVTIIPAPPGGPIYNVTKSEYYSTWAACTSSAANYDFIKVSTDPAVANLTTAGPAYQYKMSNQWNKNDYTQKVIPPVPMTLTITSVAVIADDLTL